MKKLVILTALCLITAIIDRAAAQGSLTPPGAPAPTMRTLSQVEPRTPISSLPFNIVVPGSYYFVTNLVATNSTESGIGIFCNDVKLDLNGFALIGAGGSTTQDAIGFGNNPTNCTIRNGTIQGWGGAGINGFESGQDIPNMLVENVAASGNAYGIEIGSGVVRNCVCNGNSLSGFNVVLGGVIENCIAQNTISGFNCSLASNVVVKSCSSVRSSAFGINVGPNSLVLDCTVSGTISGNAITLGFQSRAENCVVVSNQFGIYAQNMSVVQNCSIHSSVQDGLFADSSTRLINTLVDSASVNGIYLDGTNAVVDGCQVLNSTTGISCLTANGATGNLIIRNSVRGCATPYNISVNTMTGPIIGYGSGAVAATGVITNTSPWANFAY
jgi:hypothetical protein